MVQVHSITGCGLVSLIGHFCSANWAGVVSFEPRGDTILVEQVLARQLVDLVGVLELFEANLTIFRFNNVRPFDGLQIVHKCLRGGLALISTFLIHEVVERLLQNLV